MLDSLFGTGKLEKMKITVLKLSTANPPAPPTETDEHYQVQVNPDSYSISQSVFYTRNNAAGSPGEQPKYDYSSPATLDFTIIFDGTGVIPPPAGPLDNVPIVGAVASLFSDKKEFDVMAEIKKFALIVFVFKGDEHRPRQVRLTWGKQIFDGVMTNISFSYKLFKADGTPLRVEARVSFQSSLSDITKESGFKPSSPDLTHLRTTIAGDKLPLMTDKIYGTPKYYIEVAKTNKIFNFRKLKEGMPVLFYPAKETAS